MWTRATATKLGLVLLGAAFAAGFFGVLEKRFSSGDFYPHYASFRSDPLGVSAFYESLEGLGGTTVSRNVTDLMAIRGLDGDTALLLIGYPRDRIEDLRAPDDSPVMRAVKEGARLVLTINPSLVPEAYQPRRSELEDDWLERRRRVREGSARGGKEEEKREQEKKDEEDRIEKRMEETLGPRFNRNLGFDVTSPSYERRPEEGWETEADESLPEAAAADGLPMWRSQYRLEGRDGAWRTALSVDGKAVVIERRYGKGSVVLASDSYFVSNESLHAGAEPAFLLWLLGGKSKVVFDETIHGSTETGGAMKLIRRYRAHGIFLGLLVFLALWAWRSASPLVTGSEELDRGLVGGAGAVMGEGTGSGFVRLLRRSVPASALLDRCVEIWRGSSSREMPSAARERLEGILRRHRDDPRRFGVVEAYREIAELLRKR